MNNAVQKLARCAVYTRKSSEHNLDLAFTSLDAQREACEAYIRSQAGEGWRLVPDRAGSMPWWSTKSTASPARLPTSPS
jgi:site-specific DNA recombinase